VKTCRDCGQELPLTDFSPSKKNRDGRTSYCRPCFRVRDAGYRAARAAAQGKAVRPRPVLPDGHARCPACDTVKLLSEFGQRGGGRTGRASYCYPCFNRKKEESRDRLHGGSRNYHLRRRYGITAADADAMLQAQGGLCAICRERPAEHVDHDHMTGTVRGMLCFCCNQGLGNFRDRADVMEAAIGYLRLHSWQKRRVAAGVYELRPPLGQEPGRDTA
jgi:hypothetical protein